MKFTKVFAIRHTHYDGDGLTQEGIARACKTAGSIRKEIGDDSSEIYLFHSPVQRAKETALILKGQLGVEKVKELSVLNCEEFEDGPDAVRGIEEQLSNDEPVIVISVSHYRTPSGIMHEFSKIVGGTGFREKIAPYGSGYWLDAEQKVPRTLI